MSVNRGPRCLEGDQSSIKDLENLLQLEGQHTITISSFAAIRALGVPQGIDDKDQHGEA